MLEHRRRMINVCWHGEISLSMNENYFAIYAFPSLGFLFSRNEIEKKEKLESRNEFTQFI